MLSSHTPACSVGFGTPFVGMVLLSPRPPLLVKVGGFLILAISYIWAVKMVQILVARASGKRGKKESKKKE
jgi:hypothetical protein